MTQQERLENIYQHIQMAAELADEEVKDQKEKLPMQQALRTAANLPQTESTSPPPEMLTISRAFNVLTANLLYAGMPLLSGNEIHIRIKNALSETLATLQ